MKRKIPDENISNSPLVEVLAEQAEIIADGLTDNEVLRELPVFGWGLKLAKAGMNIRDRIFIAKLKAFIDEFDNSSFHIKEKWKAEVSKNGERSSRIGETLFLVVEQANDLSKPSLCAVLFIAYIDGCISEEMLFRLVQVVDKCFVSDLMYFLDADDFPDPIGQGAEWMSEEGYHLVSLEFVGLTVANSGMEVEITDLGESLRRAYRCGISEANMDVRKP